MRQLRILISRPDRIGDVVLSTPIPRELKKKYPGCFIAVLLRPYTKDIYLNNPYIDAVIVYDPEDPATDYFDKLREIRSYRFTHALMLLPNKKINYLLFLAGIRTRIGSGHKFYQFITFTNSVSRKKYIPLRHEADYCMDLARRLGVAGTNLDTEIYLSEDETRRVTEIRKKLAPEGEVLIGIHSSSGNSAPNWKPERYYELVHKLKQHKSIRVIITDNLPPRMLSNIEGVCYPNINKKLREAILNFSALDLLISASTGPMHLAAALKVRTLSLFCPLTACSPELWGPKGNQAAIVLPDNNKCGTLYRLDPKLCSFEGESNINVERVYNEALKIILES